MRLNEEVTYSEERVKDVLVPRHLPDCLSANVKLLDTGPALPSSDQVDVCSSSRCGALPQNADDVASDHDRCSEVGKKEAVRGIPGALSAANGPDRLQA